jgi:hypothetical protein
MKLETERQGRFFARRVLFKLGKAGTEACRADETNRAQAGALRCALVKLLQRGTREAVSGFACVLTDALGTRSQPGELAHLYERMEAQGRFRQWRGDSAGETGENVAEVREPDALERQSRNPDQRPRTTPTEGHPFAGLDLPAQEQGRG